MKNIFLRMFILLAAIGMSGCEKKFNDWEIDPAHDRLFKPLVFEVLTTNADSVVIKYTQVVSADKYIFEFSKDSLEFTEITKKVEIAADTLIPFAESTSPAKTEYRTTFRDLDGSS